MTSLGNTNPTWQLFRSCPFSLNSHSNSNYKGRQQLSSSKNRQLQKSAAAYEGNVHFIQSGLTPCKGHTDQSSIPRPHLWCPDPAGRHRVDSNATPQVQSHAFSQCTHGSLGGRICPSVRLRSVGRYAAQIHDAASLAWNRDRPVMQPIQTSRQ